MLASRRLRTLLAVDAAGTAVAGLVLARRPGLLGRLVPDGVEAAGPAVDDPRTARLVGIAVAGLGVCKGLLYGAALARYGRE